MAAVTNLTLTVGEARFHPYQAEISSVDGARVGDFLIVRKEQRCVSAPIGLVVRGQSAEVRLPFWQRDFLDVHPGDVVDVGWQHSGACPPARSVSLGLASQVFLIPEQDELKKVIRAALQNVPLLAGEPKQIAFPLDVTRPETTVQVLETDPSEGPVVAVAETEFLLQAFPLALLLQQARLLSQGVIEGNYRKLESLLEALREIGRSADGLAHANQFLQTQVDQMIAPALEHAMMVGPSRAPNANPDDYVVATSNGRYTVRLANASGIARSEVSEGLEVLLNQHRNIVGVCGKDRRGETAEVVDLLIDQSEKRVDRLLVRLGNVDMVVDCGEELRVRGVEIGELVRVDVRSKIALEKLRRHETGELELEEVPNVSYEQIGGLKEEIQRIKEAIEHPYLHLNLYERFNLERPKGILLYGPPGCGKTMIAKAIANGLSTQIRSHLDNKVRTLTIMAEVLPGLKIKGSGTDVTPHLKALALTLEECFKEANANGIQKHLREFLKISSMSSEALRKHVVQDLEETRSIAAHNVKSYFLNIKGPELLTKWVGESELKIRRVFEIAKKHATFNTPVVLFFDEMEALFRKRGSGISSDVELTIVPQFLSEMDGVEEYANVIVVGATNRHELLDPAVKRAGRLDVKVFIGRPDMNQAREIFERYFYPWQSTQPDRTLPLDSKELQAAGSARLLVDRMIDDALSFIYNTRNMLRVTTRKNGEFAYPIRDFASGALIRAIVGRASLAAVKAVIEKALAADGITLSMFREAIQQEFEQNRDHLIENMPELSEGGFDVHLDTDREPGYDKWDEPKQRPWLSVGEAGS